VLACHSDQALSLLSDPSLEEREILGALPYQENEVALHTDTSVLPRRREAWGAWNYRIAGDRSAPVAVTYDMNALQSIRSKSTYCVTLNPSNEIDESKVLLRTRYAHPIYTLEGMAAQERYREISGVDRTHFAGAYWGYGFHEDGVRSAFRVAGEMGVDLRGWGERASTPRLEEGEDPKRHEELRGEVEGPPALTPGAGW
jgi:predicted NAD/FAD-binding protein